MRIMLGVYALLYLVVEMIGYQLSSVGWAEITPLLVATAVTDAMLVIAVLVAVLVAADLSKHRWRPALHDWMHRWSTPHTAWWEPAEVVGVASWRPEPLALTAAPHSRRDRTAHVHGPTYAAAGSPAPSGRPFPEDGGRLL